MQLLDQSDSLLDGSTRTFRHSTVLTFVWFLLFVGLTGLGLVKGVPRFVAQPASFQVLLSPFLLVSGLIVPLILGALARAFSASLRTSNWILRVARDGVFLNLRSYLNHHFGGDDPTVAFLAWSEIGGMRKVIERHTSKEGRKRRVTVMRWLEFEVTGIDLGQLAAAIDHERRREAPQTSFLGIRLRTKHHHVPVLVVGPDRVRVEWMGGMLSALEMDVKTLPAEKLDLDLQAGSAEDLVRALALRGQRLDAVRAARTELGLDSRTAKDFVDELRNDAA